MADRGEDGKGVDTSHHGSKKDHGHEEHGSHGKSKGEASSSEDERAKKRNDDRGKRTKTSDGSKKTVRKTSDDDRAERKSNDDEKRTKTSDGSKKTVDKSSQLSSDDDRSDKKYKKKSEDVDKRNIDSKKTEEGDGKEKDKNEMDEEEAAILRKVLEKKSSEETSSSDDEAKKSKKKSKKEKHSKKGSKPSSSGDERSSKKKDQDAHKGKRVSIADKSSEEYSSDDERSSKKKDKDAHKGKRVSIADKSSEEYSSDDERSSKKKDKDGHKPDKGKTDSSADEQQISINNKFSGDGRAWEMLADGAKQFAHEQKQDENRARTDSKHAKTDYHSDEDHGTKSKKSTETHGKRDKHEPKEDANRARIDSKSAKIEEHSGEEDHDAKSKKSTETHGKRDKHEPKEDANRARTDSKSAKTEEHSGEEDHDAKSKKSTETHGKKRDKHEPKEDANRARTDSKSAKTEEHSGEEDHDAKSKKSTETHGKKRDKHEPKEDANRARTDSKSAKTEEHSGEEDHDAKSKKSTETHGKKRDKHEPKEDANRARTDSKSAKTEEHSGEEDHGAKSKKSTETRRKHDKHKSGSSESDDSGHHEEAHAKLSGDGRAWEMLSDKSIPKVDKAVERARRLDPGSTGSKKRSGDKSSSEDERKADSKKEVKGDHTPAKMDPPPKSLAVDTPRTTVIGGTGGRDKVVIIKNKSFNVHTEDERSPSSTEKAIVSKISDLKRDHKDSNVSIEEEETDSKKEPKSSTIEQKSSTKKLGETLTVPGAERNESSDPDSEDEPRASVKSKVRGSDETKNGSNVYSGDENNGNRTERKNNASDVESGTESAESEKGRHNKISKQETSSKKTEEGKASFAKVGKGSDAGKEPEVTTRTSEPLGASKDSKSDGKNDASEKGPDSKDSKPKKGPADDKKRPERDVEANKKPTTFVPPVVAGAEVEEPKPMTLVDKLLAKLKCGGKKKEDKNERMTNMKKEVDMDEHKIPLDELFQRLKTDPKTGLSEATVAEFRQIYGKNELTPPERTPEWIKFVKATFTGFGILLFIGGVLCLICFGIDKSTNDLALNDNAWLSLTLFLVVFISGSLSYYQDRSSAQIMASFQNMVPDKCVVWREGTRKELSAIELLPGDIVELKGGDKVPADVRILESNLFKVDNSSLTGESEPQTRNNECTNENPLETANIAFYSTFSLEGSAKAIVVKTGDHTVMGRIATLTIGLDVGATPIAIEINHFIKTISIVAITYGIIVFIICICYHYPFISAVLIFIGCVMGNVPEGLLIEVTVLFALTAKRMASKNCLVRKLQAVETLGSTSVICSDKTGTLTQNRMTVAHVWFNGAIHDADMSQDHFTFRNKDDMNAAHTDADFIVLAQCAALCNRAEFKSGQKEMPVLRRECIGDASENALLKYVQIAIGNVVDWRNRNPKLVEIPFNSTNKYQVSVHVLENKSKGNYLVVMKGAPERILERCSIYLANGKVKPVDDDFKEQFNGAYYTMGSMGERVLGFCDCVLPNDEFPAGFEFSTDPRNFPVEGFRFLGLMSMIDPPRPGVPDAVQKCRSAGIRVTMVTGDHPITAKAIAKSVGIFTEGIETVEDIAERLKCRIEDVDPSLAEACVIHGSQLKDMSVEELAHVLKTYKEIVFARTSPQQKLMIVEGYQKLGYFVAVTGDGVNDSPALKQADIGIAMGISGSDVSKQAADMILMDDNFASIVTGVEEGRLIFDNLKKAMTYVLITNIPEIMPFILIIPLGIPLALNTVTILCICLGTDIWPAISLAYEQAESDIMKRKPRDNKVEKLVNARLISYVYGQMGIMETVGSYFAYFVVFGECGFWPSRLFGILDDWDNINVNDLEDSYGQQWTYANRKALEYTINSVYFCANVVIQWANLIVCKTRRNSILHQGMGNWWLNSGLVFETVLCAFLCYTPGLDTGLRLYGPKFWWWWPALPFAIYTFLFDELRKMLIRRTTPATIVGNFVDQEWKF